MNSFEKLYQVYVEKDISGDLVQDFDRLNRRFRSSTEELSNVGYDEKNLEGMLEIYDNIISYGNKRFTKNYVNNEDTVLDFVMFRSSIENYLKESSKKNGYVLDLNKETNSKVQGLIKVLNFKSDKNIWYVKDRIEYITNELENMYSYISDNSLQDLYMLSNEINKLSTTKFYKHSDNLNKLSSKIDNLISTKSSELEIKEYVIKRDKRLIKKDLIIKETYDKILSESVKTLNSFGHDNNELSFKISQKSLLVNPTSVDSEIKYFWKKVMPKIRLECESLDIINNPETFKKKVKTKYVKFVHDGLNLRKNKDCQPVSFKDFKDLNNIKVIYQDSNNKNLQSDIGDITINNFLTKTGTSNILSLIIAQKCVKYSNNIINKEALKDSSDIRNMGDVFYDKHKQALLNVVLLKPESYQMVKEPLKLYHGLLHNQVRELYGSKKDQIKAMDRLKISLT